MRLQFLGTGAATAVPLPFCKCKVCMTARVNGGRDLRRRSSILIDSVLLIDMGPDLMSAAFAFGVDTSSIRYWLQTHSHADHFDPVHLATRIREYASQDVQSLKLVASESCVAHMSEKLAVEEFADLRDSGWLERLNLSVSYAYSGETQSVGPYRVTPFICDHDPRDGSMIYLVERDGRRLLYALDTGAFSQAAMAYFSSGVYLNAIIIDHTYGGDLGGGEHMNARLVCETLKALSDYGAIDGHTRVWGSHISHEGNPTHDTFVKLARACGYDVAYDGLEAEV